MALGKTQAASLSSSARWHEESEPMRVTTGPRMLTRVERPLLPHPLLSSKFVQTSLELERGAMTHSTTTKAKNPKM